jgi:hypothetical protein
MKFLIIVQSVLGLLAILIILGFVIFYNPLKKKKVVQKPKKKPKKHTKTKDFLYLKSIIKKRSSTTQDLKNSLDLIIEKYGNIPPKEKRTLSANDDFLPYVDILLSLTKHPNATKELILDFEKKLVQKNQEYKKDISDTIVKGLDKRR